MKVFNGGLPPSSALNIAVEGYSMATPRPDSADSVIGDGDLPADQAVVVGSHATGWRFGFYRLGLRIPVGTAAADLRLDT